MRRTRPKLLLTAALSACAALPALVDGSPDYRTGISPYAAAPGVNPYGVATPVPAPIPVPFEEAAWYFRADFAAGFGSQPSVNAIGTPFGGGAAAGTIGLNSAWLSRSFEPSFTGGVGIGYVWGPHIRTDFTVDLRSIMDANFNGSTAYNNGTGQTLTVQDKTSFMSTILLMNGYWDIRTGTPFTPYLGGGVGFAVDQLTQNIAVTDSSAGTDSNGSRSTQVKFAGAAMAGLTYDINTFVSLDVNYRYLFIGGSDVDTLIFSNSSKIEIGSVNDQQIRVGLRFYVN